MKEIVTKIRALGLDQQLCRAQTYDGAGNMAGSKAGCAALFQNNNKRAPCFHCASHQLNLVLSHATKVPEIEKYDLSSSVNRNFLQVFTETSATVRQVCNENHSN